MTTNENMKRVLCIDKNTNLKVHFAADHLSIYVNLLFVLGGLG